MESTVKSLTKKKKSKSDQQHLHIFIGYDDRELLEWKVCAESIRDNASRPVSIYKLDHRTLRDIGLFKRTWEITEQGTTIDQSDKRPFATQFAFSRFLVPSYSRYLGIKATDYSVFMDSDQVVLADIYGLTKEQDLSEHPVWCVKHDYAPGNVIKMDNQPQSQYAKKLWSSFMVFNLASPICGPSVTEVNEKDGSWLHSFSWLKNDTLIGGLNEGWNFIPNHSEKRVKDGAIRNIHYTEGTPLMKPNCKYSGPFNHYLRQVLNNMENNL